MTAINAPIPVVRSAGTVIVEAKTGIRIVDVRLSESTKLSSTYVGMVIEIPFTVYYTVYASSVNQIAFIVNFTPLDCKNPVLSLDTKCST
jgi:hypothetical protein